MKKLSILLMTGIALSINLCYAQEMREVIVTGSIVNAQLESPSVVKFNFCNPLIKEPKSSKVNSDGSFSASEDMLYTQNMTVHIQDNFINLFVSPGDSVHLTIDASKLDQPNFTWLTISGDNARRSTQLNLAVNYLYKLPMRSNNLLLAPKDLIQALKQDYTQYMRALEDYQTSSPIDPEVLEWLKMDVKFLLANQLIGYASEKNSRLTVKDAILVNSDIFFDLYNLDNFRSMMFPYHLDNYRAGLLRTDSTIYSDFLANRPVHATNKAIHVLSGLPATEQRDYMLYQYLITTAKKYPGIMDSIKNVSGLFTKAIYNDQFKKSLETITKPVFAQTEISGMNYLKGISVIPITPIDPFIYFKAKYPGKVLYFDVYATWCAPCLEEMKYMPALHAAMEGKDVVFINLCLQSTSFNWKKLVKEKNIKGENYFFDDDATKLFMGHYKLLGFPSYIIMDKSGVITTTNAPRPSEKNKVTEAIVKLLK